MKTKIFYCCLTYFLSGNNNKDERCDKDGNDNRI